ncbi:MAG: ROK family protein [Acidimicrobiales bacterium]
MRHCFDRSFPQRGARAGRRRPGTGWLAPVGSNLVSSAPATEPTSNASQEWAQADASAAPAFDWKRRRLVRWLGSVELGGTNCRVAIGDQSIAILEQDSFAIGDDPSNTIRRIAQWFERQDRHVAAVGVASFGPLDPSHEMIAASPKLAWQRFPLRRALAAAIGAPILIETDVTSSVFAEWTLGAGRGLDTVLYVTVGTGIGVGAVVGGRIRCSGLQPEMGHMRIPRGRDNDWPGDCAFHSDCWEGIASGHALATRYGVPAEDLANETAWRLEAEYLALGVANLSCTYRPQRIVIGGGVPRHPGLIEAIRYEVTRLLNVEYFPEASAMEDYLVPPALGERSGIIGGLLLARDGAFADSDHGAPA